MDDFKSALRRAIELCDGQSALARKIGVKQSVVWYWLEKAKRGVPAEYCSLIEEATAGAVVRHDLRPDLYPAMPPSDSQGAA